jgi:hypothetical protein
VPTFINLRMADHVQFPFGRREGSEDISMLHNQIIQYSIPTESLRLVHPMARDLVLQVRIRTFESSL